MRTIRIAAITLSLWATPALADVSARYETVEENAFIDMEMTIEVDDAGNMRMQMNGTPNYYLYRDGEMFVVSRDRGDPSVVKVSDMMAIAQETFERIGVAAAFADAPEPEPFIFSPMEEQVVQGRTGMAYGTVQEEGDAARWGSLVISNDPQLAPIGQAMAAAQQVQIQGMGSMGTMLGRLSGNMIEVLASGAPLRWMQIELTDVSFDPIPRDRFALPAEPLTIEELRAAAEPAEPPPTLPPRGE